MSRRARLSLRCRARVPFSSRAQMRVWTSWTTSARSAFTPTQARSSWWNTWSRTVSVQSFAPVAVVFAVRVSVSRSASPSCALSGLGLPSACPLSVPSSFPSILLTSTDFVHSLARSLSLHSTMKETRSASEVVCARQ